MTPGEQEKRIAELEAQLADLRRRWSESLDDPALDTDKEFAEACRVGRFVTYKAVAKFMFAATIVLRVKLIAAETRIRELEANR